MKNTSLIIIGLTGGIASGKNFVANIFAQNGAVIFDADKQVHDLLELDEKTKKEVQKYFPESVISNKIDRKSLGKEVFADKNKLEILENILHPEVRKKYQEFLEKSQKEKKKIAILNIPLLLEKGGYECDYIVAITASPSLRKRRFLSRARISNPKEFSSQKGSLEKKFEQIISKQMSNRDRKLQADFIVNSAVSKENVRKQVCDILSAL